MQDNKNDLDPTENKNPKLKQTQQNKDALKSLKTIKPPYDAEKEALKSTRGCNTEGPRVWIMTSTPEPLRTIFTAIRTCYSPYDQAYIAYEEYFKYLNRKVPDSEFPNDAIRLLAQIAQMEHLSTLEHVSFTFGVRCISRATLSQLTRHRIGWSYSVQSQRYVGQSTNSKHGVFEYIIPPSIVEKGCEEEYIQTMENLQKTYDSLIQSGVKPEDARYVLPNSATTNVTVSCNLRSFIDFYSKRSDETHSQWEIKLLSKRMKEELLKLEPALEFLFNECCEN